MRPKPNMAMAFFSINNPSFLFLLFSLSIIISISQASVSPSNTFTIVNQGSFGDYNIEYGANYRVLSIGTYPFRLCFYNTTPNAYTLAMRMGTNPSESVLRWVWEANRANPVRENATLSLRRDGNLVLANPDGKVAWQTGTAGKGVTGLQLLPNGNLVLHDSRGRYLWQSFDHPTDTLLVGQHLRVSDKLVSRKSESKNFDGSYSLVLEPSRLALYYKTLLYDVPVEAYQQTYSSVRFAATPETDEGYSYEMGLESTVGNDSTWSGMTIWGRPKYNSTMSYVRLEMDGNLRVHTFYDKVTWGYWEVTFTYFAGEWLSRQSGCALPSRCGSYGLCDEEQCVACPTPSGLTGWSRGCSPPKVGACGSKAKVVDYYKLVGVEHFMSRLDEGKGPMKVGECRDRCSKDCKCVGFFYREESSKCLLAPVLGTLSRVSNSSHVAFIKVAK